MPKHFKIRYVFLAVPLLIVGLFALFMLVECSWVAREKSYYTEKENFVTATATITSIREYEDGTLYLELGQIESNTVFSDIAFKLLPKSASKVRYEGFSPKLKRETASLSLQLLDFLGMAMRFPLFVSPLKGKNTSLSISAILI